MKRKSIKFVSSSSTGLLGLQLGKVKGHHQLHLSGQSSSSIQHPEKVSGEDAIKNMVNSGLALKGALEIQIYRGKSPE